MRTDPARHARHTLMGVAWLGVLTLGACGPKPAGDTGRAETGATDTATTGMAPADTAAAATTAKLSDANIVALLDEANKADSAAGAFALKKASDPGVKAFAKMMMGEHHALRVQGLALAKKLKVTPEPPADDPVAKAGAAEMDALNAAGTGATFDKAYIDQEVTHPQGGDRPGREGARRRGEPGAQGADREGEADDPEAPGQGGGAAAEAGQGDDLSRCAENGMTETPGSLVLTRGVFCVTWGRWSHGVRRSRGTVATPVLTGRPASGSLA